MIALVVRTTAAATATRRNSLGTTTELERCGYVVDRHQQEPRSCCLMHDSSLTNTKAKLTESPRTTRHARRLKEKKIQNSNESNNNRSSSFWHLMATSARALAGNERRARPRRLDHQVGIDKSSKTRPPRMRALRVSVKRVANKTSARARAPWPKRRDSEESDPYQVYARVCLCCCSVI